MKILDDLKTLATSWRDGLRRLTDAQAALRAKIDALRTEEDSLLRLPAPPAEIAENVPRIVQALRSAWIAKHGPELVARLSGRIARDSGPDSDRAVAPTLPDALSGLLNIEALAALAPDVLSAGLTAAATGTEYEAGAEMQARQTRLREITAEIARLEQEQTRLADEAAAVGITGVALPDAERVRRVQVVQAQGRWDAAEVLAKATRVNHGYPHEAPPRPE